MSRLLFLVTLRVRAACLLLPVAAGCAVESDVSARLAEPDEATFAQDIYPLLLRDCAMSECHGAAQRPFRVVGPGRVRLAADTEPLDSATEDELRYSYNRARSMIESSPVEGQRALLLRKPLARSAGGAEHGGEDRYGRNVYETERDPAFSALSSWAEQDGRR